MMMTMMILDPVDNDDDDNQPTNKSIRNPHKIYKISPDDDS